MKLTHWLFREPHDPRPSEPPPLVSWLDLLMAPVLCAAAWVLVLLYVITVWYFFLG